MGLRNLKPNNSEHVPKINKMRMQRIPDLSNWTNVLSKNSFDKVFYNENNIDTIRVDMDAIFYYFLVPGFELLEIYSYMLAPVIITMEHFKLKFC